MYNITIQEEKLSDIIEEIKPLIEEHYEEIAVNKHVKKLNPNWEYYLELEKADFLKVFTVRDNNLLLGYSIFVINFDNHYFGLLRADNDVVFICKELRNRKVGLSLFMFCEDKLKEDGVELVVMRTKVHQSFDALCDGLGYKNTERVYEKVIGDSK